MGSGTNSAGTNPANCGVPTIIYSEEYFARSANGQIQSASRGGKILINRTAIGRWSAVLTTPHPEGVNYHPSFQPEEQSDAGHRDGIDMHIVQGTLTAAGFDFMLTTGDNGTAADAYVDAPFTIGIDSPVTVMAPLP